MTQTADDAGPSAGPSSAPTLYTSLAKLRDELSRLQDRPDAHASLHLLDPQTAATTGYTLGPHSSGSTPSSNPSKGVSRAQFVQMISDMRQAARAFHKKSHTLAARDKAHGDQTQTAAMDKYASLGRERSQHDAQLCASVKPLGVLRRHIGTLHPALPSELMTGELLDVAHSLDKTGKCDSTAAEQGKAAPRARPRTSLEAATGVLSALCRSLEGLAKEMGLETFSEALHPDQTSGTQLFPGQSRVQRANMLTQGGKLLVIDYEVDILTTKTLHGQLRYAPELQVKISFANDTGGVHGSPLKAAPQKPSNSHNTALAELLKYDVLELARLLFGLSDSGASKGPLHQLEAERHLRSATFHYQRLRDNLQRVAELDRRSVTPQPGKDCASSSSHGGDLFAAANALANSLSPGAQLESSSAIATQEPSQRERQCIQRGHGLPLQHCGIAGNLLVYDASWPDLGGRLARTAAHGKRFDADREPSSSANDLFCAELAIEPAPRMPSPSRTAAKFKLAGDLDPASLPALPALPDTQHSTEGILGYCVRLRPSLLLPHPLCARLANIVGLSPTTMGSPAANSRSSGAGRSDQPGFWELFRTTSGSDQVGRLERHSAAPTSSSADIDVRFELEDAAAAPMQGHLISWFPFHSLGQLYAAIEVLQEASAVYKPLYRLGIGCARGERPVSSKPGLVFSVIVPPPRQTEALQLVLDCKIDTAAFTGDTNAPPVWLLSASFHRDSSAPHGYRVHGSLTNELSLLLDDADAEGSSKDLSEDLSSQLAEVLSAREDLHEVARSLRDWACGELGLKVPSPSAAMQQEGATPELVESAEDMMEVDVAIPATSAETDALKMPPPADFASAPATKAEVPDEEPHSALATVHEGVVSATPDAASEASVKAESEAPPGERETSPTGSTTKATKRRRESRSPSIPRGTMRTRRRSQQQQLEAMNASSGSGSPPPASSADPRHSPTLGSSQPAPRLTRRASAALSAASASPPRDEK